MIRIKRFILLKNKKIKFLFSDNTKKTISFKPFIDDDELSKPLADTAYFNKAELYENGRGIYWPNGYDFCPDFLYQYQPNEKELVTESG